MCALLSLMDRKASPESLAKAALADEDLLDEMMRAIGPENRNEGSRYASHLALVLLSEGYPEKLYDHWDYLAGLLRTERAHPKFNAIYILANLTRLDTERRFDGTFRDYFDLLGDESVVVAAHTAANAGKVAKFRPDLRSRITRELISIGKPGTNLRPERADLVRGYAIQAIGEYFSDTLGQEREDILEFIHRQSQSTSPKTKKLAKAFLKSLEK